MMYTLGSLFSGIGGLEMGLEMTGRFETVWQSEMDKHCRGVLRKHWPDAELFGDVREFGVNNEIKAVDVICGGFPCQDLSLAGKQVGSVAKKVDSTESLCESSGKPGQEDSSSRTCLTWSTGDLKLSSEKLPSSGTMRNGILSPLPPLVDITYAKGSLSWGTPTAHLHKEGGYPGEYTRNSLTLTAQVIGDPTKRGRLNPTWVEWLMGFPIGHTELRH